jgi:phage tail-like protein
MSELVQTFRFQVQLIRSTSPGPTTSAPPFLQARGRPRTGTRFFRPPPTAPRVGAAAAPPAASQSAGQQPAGRGAGPPDKLGDGGFAECSGLDLEADVRDYLEGGSNDSIVRRAGRVKLQPIVLKRGLLTAGDGGYADTSLWKWLQDMVAGVVPVPRYDGIIEVMDPTKQRVTAHWTFLRGLPTKLAGPSLNAKTGEIGIEELHIAHEGLVLEPGP